MKSNYVSHISEICRSVSSYSNTDVVTKFSYMPLNLIILVRPAQNNFLKEWNPVNNYLRFLSVQ